MKIAICDDETPDLELISKYLNQFDPSLSVAKFSLASHLLTAFKREFYDLVFLDIEMEETPNGYDAAVRLMKSNRKPLIVFTTKSADYTIRGYGVAFRYLLKPIQYEAFAEVIRLAQETIAPQKIEFTVNGANRLISVNSISFFEILNHEITLHTKDSSYSCRGTLSEIMSQLSSCHFAQPHKSYYVNLSFIDCVDRDEIQLTTGERIRLSRNKKALFIKKLHSYLGR